MKNESAMALTAQYTVCAKPYTVMDQQVQTYFNLFSILVYCIICGNNSTSRRYFITWDTSMSNPNSNFWLFFISVSCIRYFQKNMLFTAMKLQVWIKGIPLNFTSKHTFRGERQKWNENIDYQIKRELNEHPRFSAREWENWHPELLKGATHQHSGTGQIRS